MSKNLQYLIQLVKEKNSAKEILDSFDNNSKKGNVFEKL